MTKDHVLILYGVATAPGWSRLYASMTSPKAGPVMPPAPDMPQILQAIVGFISSFTWLDHALIAQNIIGEEASQGTAGLAAGGVRGGLETGPRQGGACLRRRFEAEGPAHDCLPVDGSARVPLCVPLRRRPRLRQPRGELGDQAWARLGVSPCDVRQHPMQRC